MDLEFPEIQGYLSGGWAAFSFEYTAPATAGTYRFYGTEQVSIARGRPQDTTYFEFEPIVVKGQLSPAFLSGILFTSPNVPLTRAGVVWAIMSAHLDPYTGKEVDAPKVNAVSYTSARDEGRYLIPGLAPGIYDIYASAIPFSTSLIKSQLRIFGQPESLDCEVHLAVSKVDNATLRIKQALRLEQEYLHPPQKGQT